VLDSAVTVEVPELIGRIGGKFVEDEEADWQIHADLLTDQRSGAPLVERYITPCRNLSSRTDSPTWTGSHGA